MLDVLAMKGLYNQFYPKESFEDKKMSLGLGLAFGSIYLLLAIWAVTLSWSSNSIAGWSFPAKIIFCIFAFVGAIQYLFVHLIHKYDLLLVIGA
jgi:hypothetical protein